jgi:hypothetical protein
MRDHKAALLAKEHDQMREMASRWLELERSLEDKVSLVARQIADWRAEGKVVDVRRLYDLDRYRALLAQLRREMASYIDYADGLITTRQAEMIRTGIDHAGESIGAVYSQAGMVGTYFDRLPVEAVEGMVGLAGNGSPLKLLLTEAYADAANGLTRALIRSTGLGINPRMTAQATQYLVDPEAAKAGLADGLNRLMTIARTEQLRVYRETGRQQMIASRVVRGYRRLAAHQARTCAACLMADGTFYPMDQPFIDHANGRCTAVPVVIGLKEIRWQTGREWFETQGEDVQRKVLGAGRFEAWQAGKFDLPQLVTHTHDDTWGGSIQVTPLKDLVAA